MSDPKVGVYIAEAGFRVLLKALDCYEESVAAGNHEDEADESATVADLRRRIQEALEVLVWAR